MKNSSIQKQRILQYLNCKLISKNKFYIETGISNGTLDKKSGLTMETFEKLYSKYPDINLEWLITGRGSMLRPVWKDVENVNSPQALGESKIEYDKAQEPKPIACRDCDEKERIIKSLEARLTDKDKQIGALENNLGMVISEKSEVIKMKDQMLEMQAKKIAELEEHSQTQKQDVGKQKSA